MLPATTRTAARYSANFKRYEAAALCLPQASAATAASLDRSSLRSRHEGAGPPPLAVPGADGTMQSLIVPQVAPWFQRRHVAIQANIPQAETASPAAVEAAATAPMEERSPPNLPSSDELHRWVQELPVHGHAYSRPVSEAYALSEAEEFKAGCQPPADWTVRLLTAAGMKSGTASMNQDAWSYTSLQSGWHIAVACDGHGEHGEVISARVSQTIPILLLRGLEHSNPEEALRSAFLDAQADLEQNYRRTQIYSGATLAVCMIHSETEEAWFAHTGDSTLTLGDIADGTVVFVTDEHKAHDPAENSRLKAAGAQVISKKYCDGEVVSRIFMPRTGVPGLAMSRSLGDGCLKKFGVVAEPEISDVSELWRRCQAPVVLLNSDGLSDTISPEEALSTLTARCKNGLDVKVGVEALCRRAQRLWIEAEGDYCDDITIILMAPQRSIEFATA
eukprot:TRINITY_DN121600_c0_g1_i1.p1 TRINITY_DN121600_c0_g1~~TRINITY_DN121600_c0_g1_i1.p1  ORF type:complete len:448 (+),score=81.10 TRINITY_DN121600_c0_g1_i1:268-1611(+)